MSQNNKAGGEKAYMRVGEVELESLAIFLGFLTELSMFTGQVDQEERVPGHDG